MPNLDLKYITDENGNRVLPITHVNAVRDSSGNTLPSLMAPEKNGSGIGTCSTSSGTALTVSLTGYELVQNGFVAVTFENDVPSNATLNINSKGAKPIYYKGSAITADTIKADDTVMFCYDGTNYVVTSLGGGGAAPVNPNETVNISLTQIYGNSEDLIGAAVTITDDDTSQTILTTTWDGSTITTEIEVNTNYTVSVETISGYTHPQSVSYQAGYQTERNINFQYKSCGAFVEATDGTLYTSSNWSGSGKTANCVVLITDNFQCRISLTEPNKAVYNYGHSVLSITSYLTPKLNWADAITDFNGKENTQKLIQFLTSVGDNNTNYAAPYCDAYQFAYPSNIKAYMASAGEGNIITQNSTAINNCLTACGGSILRSSSHPAGGSKGSIWTSTLGGNPDSTGVGMWFWDGGNTYGNYAFGCRPIADYE